MKKLKRPSFKLDLQMPRTRRAWKKVFGGIACHRLPKLLPIS